MTDFDLARRCSRALLLAGLFSPLLLTSCDEEDTLPKKLPAGDPWYELGQGETEFNELGGDEELVMVLGGQGLLMFPMPLRGGGFTIPDDPTNFTDPKTPILHLTMDIEGHNTGFGGHFFRLNNYPIPVEVQPDGSYLFYYVTIFIPDELEDICAIHGLTAQIRSTLVTDGETEPLHFDLDVTVYVPPIYDEPCE